MPATDTRRKESSSVAVKNAAKAPVKTEIDCPVCEKRDSRVLYEPWVPIEDPVKLYGAASSIPGTQRIVTCRNCSMIYESPRFPDELVLTGYRQSSEGGHDSQYPMRVNSFHRALRSLAPRLPAPGARVLDVGTAGGAFLDAATRFGYQAFGMEPSEFLVQQGVRRGLAIRKGTVDDNPYRGERFDLVCLWDVLEHVTQPAETLRALKEMLSPSGVLLINYPDIGTWQAKLAGRRFWWFISGHLHYFTRRTVAQLCRRTGYEAFHFQRYWQTLEFGYLEQMAVHYKIPLAALGKRLTPAMLQRMPLPYYASQTTALVRSAR